MTEIADKVFEAMNALAEARHIYAREEPKYGFTDGQKKMVKKHLENAKKAISSIEKLLGKKT